MRPAPAPTSSTAGRANGATACITSARNPASTLSGMARHRLKAGAAASYCERFRARLASVMLHDHGWGGCEIDLEHHATVLVRQDVTVQNIGTRVVDEPAPQLEVSGDQDCRARCRLEARRSRDRKHVPPDIRLRAWVGTWRLGARLPGILISGIDPALARLQRRLGSTYDVLRRGRGYWMASGVEERRIGVEHLHNLERVQVDVERMIDLRPQCLIDDRPLLDRIQRVDIDGAAFLEFLAVDGMLALSARTTRQERQSFGPGRNHFAGLDIIEETRPRRHGRGERHRRARSGQNDGQQGDGGRALLRGADGNSLYDADGQGLRNGHTGRRTHQKVDTVSGRNKDRALCAGLIVEGVELNAVLGRLPPGEARWQARNVEPVHRRRIHDPPQLNLTRIHREVGMLLAVDGKGTGTRPAAPLHPRRIPILIYD